MVREGNLAFPLAPSTNGLAVVVKWSWSSPEQELSELELESLVVVVEEYLAAPPAMPPPTQVRRGTGALAAGPVAGSRLVHGEFPAHLRVCLIAAGRCVLVPHRMTTPRRRSTS